MGSTIRHRRVGPRLRCPPGGVLDEPECSFQEEPKGVSEQQHFDKLDPANPTDPGEYGHE